MVNHDISETIFYCVQARYTPMVLMVRAEGAEDFLMNRLVEEAGVKVKSCNFAAE